MIIEGVSIVGVTVEQEAVATQVIGVDEAPKVQTRGGKAWIRLRLPGECGEVDVELPYKTYVRVVEPLVKFVLASCPDGHFHDPLI
jgi:hypothetical protein